MEALLCLDQEVAVLDNLSTGQRRNLELAKVGLSGEQTSRLNFIEGDLIDPAVCRQAVTGVDHILHQGALGSVPLSIEDPLGTHAANATGTLNLFEAAREAGIARIVYASSSAVYGDDPTFPKVEGRTGNLLSPYACTKAVCEQYAQTYATAFGLECIGLRYFNVFGPRQDPHGAYAAVIPLWIQSLLEGQPIYINGDGETSRDFIHVTNVVHANLLAATVDPLPSDNRSPVYNIALGERTTLNQLFHLLRDLIRLAQPGRTIPDPMYRDFRSGDIAHSHADISRARRDLAFDPLVDTADGLRTTLTAFAQG